MMNSLLKSTPAMLADSRNDKIFYTVLVILAAIGQFACASGAGTSAGGDPVSSWVHMTGLY